MVKTHKELDDFARVIASNRVPPDENVINYYNRVGDHILSHPKNMFVVYYLDNEAVSVMELFPSDNKTVGLYGLATLERFRGRGIGSAIMT